MDGGTDLTVALMFRVGRIDETPLTCGITSLARHLD
jgi:hypothetical protein